MDKKEIKKELRKTNKQIMQIHTYTDTLKVEFDKHYNKIHNDYPSPSGVLPSQFLKVDDCNEYMFQFHIWLDDKKIYEEYRCKRIKLEELLDRSHFLQLEERK